MVAGVCLPAIVAVAAVAYVRSPGGHAPASSPGAHASSAALSASQPSPSLGRWQHIATRAADPSPLTLSQLFPDQFTVASNGYIRTAQVASTHCSRAVFGAKLQAAVRRYQCSQVMRASYLAKAPKLMGNHRRAQPQQFRGRQGRRQGHRVQPVHRPTGRRSGPTRSLAKGTGLEEAEVKGHHPDPHLGVESTSLRTPRTAHQKAQLKAFSADLINRTANVSLTSRMVTGEPQVP